MALAGFDELFQLASQVSVPVGVAAAGGDDPTVLEALAEACEMGWVKPILCGKESRIRELADRLSVDLRLFKIIDSEEPAAAAVEAVHRGDAKLLMKGQIPTPSLMEAVLHPERGLRTGKTICQVVLMEIPRDDRRFLMADTGITIRPTTEQLSEIIDASVELARSIGAVSPCVGVMAATEKVTDAMPETHLAAALHKHRGDQDSCTIKGPLSFDLAYSLDAGEKKRLFGDGIGVVEIMVFPNLLSANLTVKGLMYAADCRFGGVLERSRMSGRIHVASRRCSDASSITRLGTDTSQLCRQSPEFTSTWLAKR